MPDYVDYDEFEDEQESFAKRKDKTKPKGRRSINQLQVDEGKATSSVDKFDDVGLQRLFEQGYISNVIRQLHSGKEATLYLADGPSGLLAAKVYADRSVRAFKVDDIYLEGRYVNRARKKKAARTAAATRLSIDEQLWIEQEYLYLQQLHKAGVKVPEPIAHEGAVILMDYLGDENNSAPRLADAELSEAEADAALKQSFEHVVQMLLLNKVHGDYSAYNLLWWQQEVVVIDLPQMVDIKENRFAFELLKRDLDSLARSFQSLALDISAESLLQRLRQRLDLKALFRQ